MTKICLKQNEVEEILEILHTRLEKEENGDLYYCLARVYKFAGRLEEYDENLKLALKNPYTLTFPKDIVTKEYSNAEAKIGRHQEIEPEAEISEFEEESDEDFEGEEENSAETEEYSEPQEDEEDEEDTDDSENDEEYDADFDEENMDEEDEEEELEEIEEEDELGDEDT